MEGLQRGCWGPKPRGQRSLRDRWAPGDVAPPGGGVCDRVLARDRALGREVRQDRARRVLCGMSVQRASGLPPKDTGSADPAGRVGRGLGGRGAPGQNPHRTGRVWSRPPRTPNNFLRVQVLLKVPSPPWASVSPSARCLPGRALLGLVGGHQGLQEQLQLTPDTAVWSSQSPRTC